MRISQLPTLDRKVAEGLAIAGAPVPRAVLLAATGARPAELFAALGRLQVGKLTRAIASDTKPSVAIFHDRIRESVAAKLDEREQVRWHGQLTAQSIRVPIKMARMTLPMPLSNG